MQPDVHAFLAIASFAFGAVVGSFLNVVVLRLPAGESIVHPPSRCPVCGHSIRFYDNIPILSYVVLFAKCRDCGTRISARYPLVEFMTACLSCGLMAKLGPGPEFLVLFAFCAAMVVVFWIDLDHMIIPDVISLNGLVIGILAAAAGFLPGVTWKQSVVGFLLGGAILYVPAAVYEKIRGVEGLGGGDIKLLAMMGTFIGPYGVIFVLFFSSLAGSLIAFSGMLVRRTASTTPIPFGPFLTGAGVLYVFAGADIVERFFGTGF